MLIITKTTQMFVLIIIRSFPHSLLITGFATTIRWRVPLVHSRFLVGVLVARSLVFYVVFCRSLFVLFLLAILLFFLRFADFDYTFGIFKLVFLINARPHNKDVCISCDFRPILCRGSFMHSVNWTRWNSFQDQYVFSQS